METPTINIINDRLQVIPESQSQEVIDYLDFLTYRHNQSFVLTDRHLELLAEGDKTPTDQCRNADDVIRDLRLRIQK